MRWRIWTCALVLVAQPAVAEPIVSDGFSMELDTHDACIVVPEGRRVESACAGVEPLPTTLPNIDDKPASYVFLASIPLAPPARSWLGVIRLFPPEGVDRNGLTLSLGAIKYTLRTILSREGSWHVSEPQSSATLGEYLDRATIQFDLGPKDDPDKSYVASFALYFGTNDYMIETFVDGSRWNEAAARTGVALQTLNVAPRKRWDPAPDVASAMSWFRTLWFASAFVIVIGLVVRDVRSRRDKKPQRDANAIDVSKYASARRFGALASLGLGGGVVAELLGHALVSAAPLLHVVSALLTYASLAPLLLWVHRVTVNARALGCVGVPTASMAVTWFLVPIASVFMPYRAVADVAASMRGPGRMDAVWRVALWWIPVVATFASRLFGWNLACTLFTAMASLAAWSMVVAIDRGHARMLRKVVSR